MATVRKPAPRPSSSARRSGGGIRVTVNSRGTDRLALKFTNRINLLGGPTIGRILGLAADEWVKQYQLNIQRMTPGGFPPLSKEYKKRKAALVGFVYPMLWRTGYMASHIGRRILTKPWRIHIFFGGGIHPDAQVPTAKLAQWHIEGDPMTHLPARDFTQVTPAWRKRWTEKLRRALRKAMQ